MALACYCRLLSQQPKLINGFSLQHVVQNIHSTSKIDSQYFLKKWIKVAKRSNIFHINTRNFRSRRIVEVQPKEVHATNSQGNPFSVIKSAAFVTAVGTCSFFSAMIWNYENVRRVYKEMATEKPIRQRYVTEKLFGFRQHMNAIWSSLDTPTKLTFGIISANVMVWGLWRVPRLQHAMVQYFSSAAAHPRLSMVLSSFSHMSFLHLAVNMYVLLSFAPVVIRFYGQEQFSAFYITAGTVSAFTSIVCQQLLRRPWTISVGASGAIMALLGVTGVIHPNARLQIAFISEIIPHSFSADTGIKAIMLFDLIGLLMGWRVLDHAGHLGGIVFGMWYAKYGSQLIWGCRDSVTRKWHDLRGKP